MKRKLLSFVMLLVCTLIGHRAIAQNEEWQPKFEEVQAGVEYYLYNVGTKTYLNDDNTLSAIPSVTWTVDGYAVKSQNGKYISVTSINTGTLFNQNWVVSVATNAASPVNVLNRGRNQNYYTLNATVQTGSFSWPARYVSATAENTIAVAENANSGTAQWIFVNANEYNNTFSADKESVEFGNVVTGKTPTIVVTLNYSPRLGDVTVSSDNNIFTVSPATIEGVEGAPTTTEITITYNTPTLGRNVSSASHSGNVTISAGDKSIVIPVSGTTKKALSLDNLMKGVEYAEGIIANAEVHLGFDQGDYAPYAGREYRALYAKALDVLANEANYSQDEVDKLYNNLRANNYNIFDRTNYNTDSKVWAANSREVNAVEAGTVITDVYGNDAPNNLMPLKGNQAYKLQFNYTGTTTVTIKDGNGDEVVRFAASSAEENASYSYVFYTKEAGNYTINVNGAELTNVNLVTTTDPSKDWTPITLEDGAKYLFINKATGYFIGSSDTMHDYGSMAFTAVANADSTTYSFKNEDGTYLNLSINVDEGLLGTGGQGTPTSVTVSPAGAKTDFTITEANGGYLLSTQRTWQYGGIFGGLRQEATYKTYLSALAANGSATLTEKTIESDSYNVWVLVSEEEYNSSDAVRKDAIARLQEAVDAANEILQDGGPLFGAVANVTAQRTAAQYLLLVSGLPTTTISSMNNTADALIKAIEGMKALLPNYNAAVAALEEINGIGGIVSAEVAAARAALEIANTPEAMESAITTLRIAAAAAVAGQSLLGDVTPFKDNTNFTGLIANNSFDFGSMAGWYTLSFDANLSNLGNLISGGGLGALADIIKIQDFAADSKPVVNEAPNAVAEGHNRFYYNTQNGGIIGGLGTTGQPIFQPLIGLPAGSYKASALMTSNTLIGGFAFQNYINAIVIPTNILGDFIGNIDITDPTNMGNLLRGVMGSLGTIISQGALVTGSNNPASSNTFEEVSVEFEIEESAIVILVLNSGVALPLVGAEPFRADNVRLVMTQSRKSAKDELANAIKNADIPVANIAAEANNDNPFTYNEALVKQYKSLKDAAQAVQDKGTNSAIDMHKAASALADFSATFLDKAFQGPTEEGVFNVVMNDPKNVNLLGKSVTVKDGVIAFTDEAGTTDFNQAFSFEKAGDAVNSYVISYTDAEGKHYLSSINKTEFRSVDKENATIFNIVPSTTEETAVSTQLHTSLKVVPAVSRPTTISIGTLVKFIDQMNKGNKTLEDVEGIVNKLLEK